MRIRKFACNYSYFRAKCGHEHYITANWIPYDSPT